MKPIETPYEGYRFRSRLEARWAVFFDALGIKWEYEKEGYELSRGHLSSLYYLPDFWLPELDCWIEIKGVKPTPQEEAKAHYLALNSKKRCYIFSGNIGVYEETNTSAQLYRFERAVLRHPEYEVIHDGRNLLSLFGDDSEAVQKAKQYAGVEIEIDITDALPHNTLDVLSGEGQSGMSMKVNSKGELEFVELREHTWKPGQKEAYIQLVGDHVRFSNPELFALLKQYPGWTTHAIQNMSSGHVWVECSECHKIMLTDMECAYPCPSQELKHDSPRLLEAYTAARQARFEHGEMP